MRINQNVMANNASRNLAGTSVQLGKSLEKLSSGFRINRAADDSAGLVISQGLRAQTSGLRQATRNAQDGISVVQTAEGALNEVHTMLNRMRDLAVQSANTGANDTNARTAANSEITALKAEVDRISATTSFGATKLLDGNYGKTAGVASAFDANNSIAVVAGDDIVMTVAGGAGAVTVELQAGTYTGSGFAAMVQSSVKAAYANATDAEDIAFASSFTASATAVGAGTAVSFSNGAGAAVTIADGTGTPLVDGFGAGNPLIGAGVLAAATGSGGTFQVGANANETVALSITSVSTTTLNISSIDVTTDAGAAAALTSLDSAISTVSSTRGSLGALQNRFESMINNLQVTTENLSASESRIRDTDMAMEMVSFTKNQVLSQAGTAMLAQANQIPQSILSLLR
jgi:flagellin